MRASMKVCMHAAGIMWQRLVYGQAMAAHNSGGVVIVQVERLVASGTLPARMVHIPGAIVDKVHTNDDHHYPDSIL